MSDAQIISGIDTRPLLANLGLAIDESLVRKISSLSKQIRRIEYSPGQADRVRFLKGGISNLEDQLSDIRKQAS